MVDTESRYDSSKRTLRSALRSQRAALDVAELTARDYQLQLTGLELLRHLAEPATTVTAFLPMTGEPPVLGLLTTLHHQGVQVYVPVCLPEFSLRWARWAPDVELEPGLIPQLLEPVGPRLTLGEVSPSALLIPALAVDAMGTRLGQGAGYYDRALADMPVQVPTVAVIHASEFLDDALPSDPWDVPMQYVLSEEFYAALPR